MLAEQEDWRKQRSGLLWEAAGKGWVLSDSAHWSIKAGSKRDLAGKPLQASCNTETRMPPSAPITVCCWWWGRHVFSSSSTFLISHDYFSPVEPELEPWWQVTLGNKCSEGGKDDNKLRADRLTHGGKIHRKHGTANSHYWQWLCF